MSIRRWVASLHAATFALIAGAIVPAGSAYGQTGQPLSIDVPVTIAQGNVVMDVGHAVFSGDTPFFVGDLSLLMNEYTAWKAPSHIVVVFHGDAAYLVLNDASYDAVRHVSTGNPYSKVVANWIAHGVQIELCGATAAANHWGNADLLSGVKVDTDAMVRVTQLEQQGYTLIYQ